jgi:hypothetical protein
MFRRVFPLVLALAILAAACDAASEPSTTTTTTTIPLPTTTSTTVAATTTAAPEAACLGGNPAFVTDGVVAALGREAGDATVLTDVLVFPDVGCERITLGFATDGGAPASSLGRIDVRLLPDIGVVRVALPEEVTAAAITDGLVETEMVDAFYVVRADDHTLFVDLHLAEGAEARAGFAAAPVRLVLDLRPGEAPLVSQPTRGFLAVVLEPGPGEARYPLRVTGYARPFEASLTWRLYQEEQVIEEGYTMTTDYTEAWGWFEFDVPAGPSGEIGLFAGDLDQETGLPRGARVTLQIP